MAAFRDVCFDPEEDSEEVSALQGPNSPTDHLFVATSVAGQCPFA